MLSMFRAMNITVKLFSIAYERAGAKDAELLPKPVGA